MDIVYILKDALESGFIWALLALGVFISFRVLDFADLTVEGSLTFGGAITASLLTNTDSVFFAFPMITIIIAVLGGMLAGLMTGFLHAKLKIPGILAGIISMTALYSINLLVMRGAALYIGNTTTVYAPLEHFLKNVIQINDMQWVKFLTKSLTSFGFVLLASVGI